MISYNFHKKLDNMPLCHLKRNDAPVTYDLLLNGQLVSSHLVSDVAYRLRDKGRQQGIMYQVKRRLI